jgi:hypothetical protein
MVDQFLREGLGDEWVSKVKDGKLMGRIGVN